MKLKLLPFMFLLISSLLNAQDTIRTLLITEARMDRADQAFVEISNVGNDSIQLSDFEFGVVKYWITPYSPPPTECMRLPEKMLPPGESFVLAMIYDHTEEQYPKFPDKFNRNVTKKELWEIADIQIHRPEANSTETDSITPHHAVLNVDGGSDCWYLEQHLSETDSVIVDQVGGVFDGEGGRNNRVAYDVAGVYGATSNSVLIRKFIVKSGNDNFADARGNHISDSEWIPVPFLYDSNYDPFRAVFWTLGNHGDYKLESSLKSNLVSVDWQNKKIVAPWGVRNNDDFLKAFDKMPGLAWHYHLSPAREDSAYQSARTGDRITIYACGNDLEVETFDIIVEEPTESANIVIPKFGTNSRGIFPVSINSGAGGRYEVTVNSPVMDTITNSLFGIEYATQKDTLLKYLEKAPKANWEIVWIDGINRTAVQTGDILRVTAENGNVKQYYIKVADYRSSNNANLSSITWPDIPNYYKGIFGWVGDTIPGFSPTVYNYKIMIPIEIEGIPALVAKTSQLNATVDVKRAFSLNGTMEQRTITFTVTAEDGITERVYNVQLEKEKNQEDIQPYNAEPFLSEHVFRDQFGNGFIEICNPGNQPLDLSNYMMYFGYDNNPFLAAAAYSGPSNWGVRYRKYIPGYKWVDQAQWQVTPGMAQRDLNVNSIILPGDVFVMGHITRTNVSGYPWFASEQCDVDFGHLPGETYSGGSAASMWLNTNFFIYKILNDSIKLGLKPANDPDDFELVETFGMGDGRPWVIGGYSPSDQQATFIRKPEFYKGKTEFKESFGTNPDDSEWLMRNRAYWTANGVSYPNNVLFDAIDLGQHFMYEVTDYKSTITSFVYKVSQGYSMNETIKGMRTGLTVEDFLSNIIKANDNQILNVKGITEGTILTGDAVLSMNDTLIVLSADSTNTSKYILEVSDQGLSPDAVLTSEKFMIEIESQPETTPETKAGTGSISGFEYGTTLTTILANIQVPAGALLTVIDDKGAYVPRKMLNLDTTYVVVTVNHNIFFEVIAEDGNTKIVYQLKPEYTEQSAFVISDLYSVIQSEQLIQFIPRGTSVGTLIANLVPSFGASLKLVDKYGHERINGQVVQDDKIIVTSPNGLVTKVYHLAMLRDQYLLLPTYLAYVLSNTYSVDQLSMTIEGPTGKTALTEFYSNIIPSMGANAVIVDSNGQERDSGDLNEGDKLKVTSADGTIVVTYSLELDLTPADIIEIKKIIVYPNPTSDRINISGAGVGARVKVLTSTGAIAREIVVKQNIESISMNDLPSGLYHIIITNNSKIEGNYKIVKK